jgi:hypothetical protein
MSGTVKSQILEILENLDPDAFQMYLLEAGNQIGELKEKRHSKDLQNLIFTHGELMQVAALLKVQ